MKSIRPALLLLASTMLGACSSVVTRDLPQGFYTAAAPAPAAKIPLRVAVVSEGLPALSNRSFNPLAMGKVRLQAYPQEVATMLGEVYRDVALVPTAAEAGGSDLRVMLGSDYPKTVTLLFQDGSSGDVLATLTEPGDPFANHGKLSVGGNIFFYTIGFFGFGPVILNFEARSQADRYSADIQKVTLRGLQSLRERIRNIDELVLTRSEKAALRELELQGDAALASDPVGALLAYQQALARVQPGNARALALQGKAVAAVSRSAAPPVPEEAQNRMAEGRAALALAKSPADYRLASDAMERALSLAPWWATGHFNAALTQESAGLWSNAAAHLKMFLQLEPQSADREKLRLKIAELELHQKRGDLPAGMSAER